jgi:putative ABC transport system permease protein
MGLERHHGNKKERKELKEVLLDGRTDDTGHEGGWLEDLSQDMRYGYRILKRNFLYASISIFTLSLGIGASTAIFSVVYGVLLHTLPYHKPEQIVQIWEVNSRSEKKRFADPNFEDVRAQLRPLQAMAEMYSNETPVTTNDVPDRVTVAHVSSDFFSVMGVQPLMGRLFIHEEQEEGAASMAIVSYAWWKSHLHETHDLGSVKFTVAQKPTVIIGVLPPGFAFPRDSQIWMARETEDIRLPSRRAHNWQVVGRLRESISLDLARSDASALARRLYKQYGAGTTDMADIAIIPLQTALTANVKPALLILFGVAGLLLLVAYANVINLSLAQISARGSELAVRAALGASRIRLVRQFLAESFLLCFLGSCLGVAAAYIAVAAFVKLAPPIPRVDEISVNLPALCFALGICLLVAIGLGLITALRTPAGDVQDTLSEAGRYQGVAGHTQRTGRMIVAGQIAITLTLMIGAGLLGRSMLRVLSINPGFETDRILTMDLYLPELESTAEVQRVAFLKQLTSRLGAIPGVKAVGGTNAIPFLGDPGLGLFVNFNPQQLRPADRDLIDRSAHIYYQHADPAFLTDLTSFLHETLSDSSRTTSAYYVVASEGYFQALGIPLRQGRLFSDGDGPNAPHAAVISESVARLKWPDRNPIGQTIEFGSIDGDLRPLTIVGVVGDIRERMESEPYPTVYVYYQQRPRKTSEFVMVLRTNSDSTAIFAAARNVLNELDPTIPARTSILSEVLSESLNSRRFNLFLVGVFALTALLLAMAGVFGVLMHSVAQRTREIGVRMALGATSGRVLKMILTQGLVPVMIGTALGLTGSFLLTQTMRSLLYQISPTDPLTLVGVVSLLLLVAAAASWIPARRATRIDPIDALRHE